MTSLDTRNIRQTKPNNTDKASELNLPNIRKTSENPLDFKSCADKISEIFDRLDKDKSNSITKNEISAAMIDRNYNSLETQAIVALYDNFDKIKNLEADSRFQNISKRPIGASNEEISKQDVANIKDIPYLQDENDTMTTDIEQSTSTTAKRAQRAGMCKDLYAHPANPIQDIKPDAVRQGFIGNCYIEASLAALAATNPKQILDMIKDNKDGTCTVTFPGDVKNPVTVSIPTEAEMTKFNAGSPHGTWASVIEKAYGAYRQENDWFAKGDKNLPQTGTADGGRADLSLQLLTGLKHGCAIIPSGNEAIENNSKEVLLKILKANYNSKDKVPIVIGTQDSPQEFADFEDVRTELTPDHAYSVISFDQNGKNGTMITLRDPRGDSVDEFGKVTPATTVVRLESLIKSSCSIYFYGDSIR